MYQKSKKVVIIVAVLVILLVIGAVGFFMWYNSTKINPEDTLVAYVDALKAKDYETMYSKISEESKNTTTKEDFIARNKNIYEGIEASNLSINIVQVTEEGNKAQIVYSTTMQTVAGQMSFSNTANLVKNAENGYDIEWSSSLIFPELQEDYKVRVETLEGTRGRILDRNDVVLAGMQTASSIGLVPGKMGENKEEDIARIATLLDISEDTIQNALSASYVKDDTFVPLKTVQKGEQELKNQLLEISGIKIIDTTARVYPLGEASSHLLGYVQTINAEELKENANKGYTNTSVIGKTGLEKIYEDTLKATDGAEIYIVDAEGNKKKTLAKKQEQNGKDIKLTIDSTIQQKLYNQLKEDKAAAVAMNPNTGEILALVSCPTFNSNDFSLGMTTNQWNRLSQNEAKPLYNRYLQTYVPGSSFKPITGAIGLDTNSFTADEDFGSSGTKWQASKNWRDFYVTTLTTYNGPANLQNALIYSDNIYFAKAGIKIGKQNFMNQLNALGFSKKISFEQELGMSTYSNSGSFETETQLANTGYGQGELLVNPVHMAMIYSSFANEGNMLEAYLMYKEDKTPTYYAEQVFSKETANTIKEDLIQVVENPNGTAHSAKIDGVTIAAKTGTAEIKDSKEDTEGTELGWFNAFTADKNAQNPLLIVSMVEDVKNKGGSHYVLDKIKPMFE